MAGFPKKGNRNGENVRQPQPGVKIPTDQIIQALIKTRGNISRAADKLGCSRHAIHLRSQAEPDIKQVLQSCRERFLDESEDVLQEKVLSGDTTSLLFTLKTLGRKRGYDMDNNIIAESVTRGALDWIMNKSKNPAE